MKGYKTVGFGVLLGLLSIFSNPDMQAWAAEHIPELGGSIGTIVVILRALTANPIFNIKDSEGL